MSSLNKVGQAVSVQVVKQNKSQSVIKKIGQDVRCGKMRKRMNEIEIVTTADRC